MGFHAIAPRLSRAGSQCRPVRPCDGLRSLLEEAVRERCMYASAREPLRSRVRPLVTERVGRLITERSETASFRSAAKSAARRSRLILRVCLPVSRTAPGPSYSGTFRRRDR